MRLTLIRHGETDSNRFGNPNGMDENEPLSKRGVEQVLRLADAPWIETARKAGANDIAVWSSPLLRARQTALALGLGPPKVDARLMEQSQPGWHDKPWQETETREALAGGPFFACPERVQGAQAGESHHDVAERMMSWLRDIMGERTPDYAETVVAVSHGVAIRCLLWRIMGFDAHFVRTIAIANTHACELVWSAERGWSVIGINVAYAPGRGA